MNPDNAPPKDIAAAIHGACFDYYDMESYLNIHGAVTIEERVYNCWQMILHIIKKDPEQFIEFIKKEEPDLSFWDKTTKP